MRTTWRERKTPVWVGAAVVSALVVGAVLGSWMAPRPAQAQPPAINFNGNLGVWQWVVPEGQTANFERAARAYGQALAARNGGNAGFTLYRSSVAAPGQAIYFGHISSVAAGNDYQVITVMAQHFPPGPPSNGDEVRDLYTAYTGAVAQTAVYDLSVVGSY